MGFGVAGAQMQGQSRDLVSRHNPYLTPMKPTRPTGQSALHLKLLAARKENAALRKERDDLAEKLDWATDLNRRLSSPDSMDTIQLNWKADGSGASVHTFLQILVDVANDEDANALEAKREGYPTCEIEHRQRACIVRNFLKTSRQPKRPE